MKRGQEGERSGGENDSLCILLNDTFLVLRDSFPILING